MKASYKRLYISLSFIASAAFTLRMAILATVWPSDVSGVRAHKPHGYELGYIAASIAYIKEKQSEVLAFM